MESITLYNTPYGIGQYVKIEDTTNKFLINIIAPNKAGKKWIWVHSGNALGAFKESEIEKLTINNVKNERKN